MTDPKTRQITQRRFQSQLSDQICYAVLCVFSYIELQGNKSETKGPTVPSSQ